jgi:hypothetical protein
MQFADVLCAREKRTDASQKFVGRSEICFAPAAGAARVIIF